MPSGEHPPSLLERILGLLGNDIESYTVSGDGAGVWRYRTSKGVMIHINGGPSFFTVCAWGTRGSFFWDSNLSEQYSVNHKNLEEICPQVRDYIKEIEQDIWKTDRVKALKDYLAPQLLGLDYKVTILEDGSIEGVFFKGDEVLRRLGVHAKAHSGSRPSLWQHLEDDA